MQIRPRSAPSRVWIRTYTDLAVKIKTNVEIVPIIIGATGTMYYNNFERDIEKLKLEQVTFDKFHAQKITLLGTAHIVRGFLQLYYLFIYTSTWIDI